MEKGICTRGGLAYSNTERCEGKMASHKERNNMKMAGLWLPMRRVHEKFSTAPQHYQVFKENTEVTSTEKRGWKQLHTSCCTCAVLFDTAFKENLQREIPYYASDIHENGRSTQRSHHGWLQRLQMTYKEPREIMNEKSVQGPHAKTSLCYPLKEAVWKLGKWTAEKKSGLNRGLLWKRDFVEDQSLLRNFFGNLQLTAQWGQTGKIIRKVLN